MVFRNPFKFGIFLCWAYALMRTLRVRISSWRTEQTHQFLTRMLRVRISSWHVCSACFEVTTLSAQISSWRECSVCASVPDPYAQGTHNVPDTYAQHVMKGLRSVHRLVPDANAQYAHQFLIRTCWGYTKLTFEKCESISSWHAHLACAAVPDSYAQCAHKGRRMRIRNSIFSIIFKE
jgi:hypothetical protein